MYEFEEADQYRAIQASYFLGSDFNEGVKSFGSGTLDKFYSAFPSINRSPSLLLGGFLQWFRGSCFDDSPEQEKLRKVLKKCVFSDNFASDKVALVYLNHSAAETEQFANWTMEQRVSVTAISILQLRKKLIPDFGDFVSFFSSFV